MTLTRYKHSTGIWDLRSGNTSQHPHLDIGIYFWSTTSLNRLTYGTWRPRQVKQNYESYSHIRLVVLLARLPVAPLPVIPVQQLQSSCCTGIMHHTIRSSCTCSCCGWCDASSHELMQHPIPMHHASGWGVASSHVTSPHPMGTPNQLDGHSLVARNHCS